MKQFLKKIVAELNFKPDRARVAMITFAFKAEKRFDLDDFTTKETLNRAIDSLDYPYGQTNLTGALRVMREEVFTGSLSTGDRPLIRNIVIVITDGEPNLEANGLMEEVNRNKQNGVRFLAVGVTEEVNNRTLKAMLDYPEDDYIFIKDFSKLHEILDKLVFRSCEIITTRPPTGRKYCVDHGRVIGGHCQPPPPVLNDIDILVLP